jgi:hypothetical protein
MDEGVLYVVSGTHTDRYLKAAARSIRSLRQVMPDVRVALAGQGADQVPGIDRHVEVSEPDGFRAKIVAMRSTPFDKTLFLDVDTHVIGELASVFELLDTFDVAAAHAPGRINMPLDDVPVAFPEFNTGVVAFRRDERVLEMLDSWKTEYDRLAPMRPATQDQPSFRRAVYHQRGLRVATLPPEFNVRFGYTGVQSYEARVLHGWADAPTYEALGTVMATHGSRVFAGGRLFNGHGKLDLDFADHRRLRRLRSFLLRRL